MFKLKLFIATVLITGVVNSHTMEESSSQTTQTIDPVLLPDPVGFVDEPALPQTQPQVTTATLITTLQDTLFNAQDSVFGNTHFAKTIQKFIADLHQHHTGDSKVNTVQVADAAEDMRIQALQRAEQLANQSACKLFSDHVDDDEENS